MVYVEGFGNHGFLPPIVVPQLIVQASLGRSYLSNNDITTEKV